MLLTDIHFEDKIARTPLGRIYAFFHQEPKCYRKLGIGTATLKFLIKYVKEKGIKKLHGSIAQDDFNANPKLIKWYQDNGFTYIQQVFFETQYLSRQPLYIKHLGVFLLF